MVTRLPCHQIDSAFRTISLTPFVSSLGMGKKASHTASTSSIVVSNNSRSNLRITAASVRKSSAYARLYAHTGYQPYGPLDYGLFKQNKTNKKSTWFSRKEYCTFDQCTSLALSQIQKDQSLRYRQANARG